MRLDSVILEGTLFFIILCSTLPQVESWEVFPKVTLNALRSFWMPGISVSKSKFCILVLAGRDTRSVSGRTMSWLLLACISPQKDG